MHMKMARASERDIQAALDVSNILDGLDRGYMPSETEEPEPFYPDDREQCQRALDALLRAAQTGNIFRVIFGMATILDPRNELLDPDADTLELHPKLKAALNPWQPISAAPIEDEGNFLVQRKNENGHEWIEEVFAFEGQMYPQRCYEGVCWDHRVTDAVAWMPLPSPPADTGAQS